MKLSFRDFINEPYFYMLQVVLIPDCGIIERELKGGIIWGNLYGKTCIGLYFF